MALKWVKREMNHQTHPVLLYRVSHGAKERELDAQEGDVADDGGSGDDDDNAAADDDDGSSAEEESPSSSTGTRGLVWNGTRIVHG